MSCIGANICKHDKLTWVQMEDWLVQPEGHWGMSNPRDIGGCPTRGTLGDEDDYLSSPYHGY